MRKPKFRNLFRALAVFLLLNGTSSFTNAADLKVAFDCSSSSDLFENFRIREISFRNDHGKPSIRIYARNSDKAQKREWNPLKWTRKQKLVAAEAEQLPADVIIRFERSELLEALSLYSTISQLFHDKRLDTILICGGKLDTNALEAFSMDISWCKEGSIRFW